MNRDTVSLSHREKQNGYSLFTFCFLVCTVLFFKYIYSSILLFFMQLLCFEETPCFPPETLHLPSLCECSPSLCAFSSPSPSVCAFARCTLSPINPLGFSRGDQSAAQHPDRGSLGPRCTDNDGENEKKKKR